MSSRVIRANQAFLSARSPCVSPSIFSCVAGPRKDALPFMKMSLCIALHSLASLRFSHESKTSKTTCLESNFSKAFRSFEWINALKGHCPELKWTTPTGKASLTEGANLIVVGSSACVSAPSRFKVNRSRGSVPPGLKSVFSS